MNSNIPVFFKMLNSTHSNEGVEESYLKVGKILASLKSLSTKKNTAVKKKIPEVANLIIDVQFEWEKCLQPLFYLFNPEGRYFPVISVQNQETRDLKVYSPGRVCNAFICKRMEDLFIK